VKQVKTFILELSPSITSDVVRAELVRRNEQEINLFLVEINDPLVEINEYVMGRGNHGDSRTLLITRIIYNVPMPQMD